MFSNQFVRIVLKQGRSCSTEYFHLPFQTDAERVLSACLSPEK